MLESKHYNFSSEFYVVAKMVELVAVIAGHPQRVRLEAHEHLPSGKFSATAYIREDITVQPTYPKSSDGHDRKPENFEVWVNYDLPWTDRSTADDALIQALAFLRERCAT